MEYVWDVYQLQLVTDWST